jgi:hypothetical protein
MGVVLLEVQSNRYENLAPLMDQVNAVRLTVDDSIKPTIIQA